MKDDKEFSKFCVSVLNEILKPLGYAYDSTYVRPVGVVVVFTKDSDMLFISCEGDVLYVDLLVVDPSFGRCRIGLNELLWYHGVRFCSKGDCLVQVSDLKGVLMTYAEAYLRNAGWEFDNRFCFKMSNEGFASYKKSQFGKGIRI